MKDLFDEFMEELRRRQAEAEQRPEGARSGAESPAAASEDGAPASEATDDGPDETMGSAGRQPDDEAERADGDADADAGEPSEEGGEEPAEPTPLRGGRRRGAPPPRGRSDAEEAEGGRPGIGCGLVLGILGVVLFLVFVVGGFVLDLWTDAIWFTSVGYDAVFWTRIGTQVALLLGGLVVALVFLLVNIWIARRLSPPPAANGRGTVRTLFERMGEAARTADRGGWTSGRYRGPDDEVDPFSGWGTLGGRGGRPVGPRPVTIEADLPDLTPLASWAIVLLAVLLAVGIASAVSGAWETIQLFIHRVPYAPSGPPVVDPVFGRDISFFLFDLPFLRLVQSLLNGLLLAALIVTLATYLVGGLRGTFVFTTPVRVHLAVLVGLYLLSIAAGYQLDKFELVYSTRGVATGVSYTDANAQFFAFDALTVIAALSAAFLVGAAFTRMVWPLGLAVGVWFVASIVLGQFYPDLVQRFTVEPNQLATERPYIVYNIGMTRQAYSLESWRPIDYGGEAPVTASTIADEASTFRNARIWDYRPLRDVLDQIQTVRQYYDFTDVDTDRYVLGGSDRQVMLSARELAPEKNPQANSWVNQRLTFTHGVGAAMVPVNEATEGGQPVFLIRDLPPASAPGAPAISQFRIYFGERPNDWVVVGAKQPEFDYPVGSDTVAENTGAGQTTRWTATTGIRIENTLTRLLFAARFRDLNLLISDQITSDSQLLFHRYLADRLPRIAPFLYYDKDPYLVVRDDGSLVWIQDAYTVSDRFPNAQAFDPTTLPAGSGLGDASFDYVRNSVKIVMNAYDGTMTFYVSDPADPLIRAYEGVFPTLFKPLATMPPDIVPHLRYPEDLFNVQTRMFSTYHVVDPSAFYNREDLWTLPADTGNEQTLPSEAYYVEMRMPEEANTEFLLLQPMVPQRRPNMIAWVAVRNDAPHYGETRVYQFPQNTSVLGPNQIEAKIDADPTISAQISLWNQSGSKVIRGNLIVLPVQDSLMYLQPVYLQSTSSAFPELQKVIVATSTTIVWGDTLADALTKLLAASPGGGPAPSPSPSPGASATPAPSVGPPPSVGPGPTPPAGDVQALVAFANRHFELAQAALRNGDFATYGAEMKLVQEALRQLSVLTGASAAP